MSFQIQDSTAAEASALVDTTIVPDVVAQQSAILGETLAETLGLPPYLVVSVVKFLTILGVFVVAWILIKIVDRATRSWLSRYDSAPVTDPYRQRAATLGDLFGSAVRYIAWPMASIMALSELGLDVAALIATAGVAGLAVGFGAQTLVKDVISGIFLLFDDSIHVGDLVRLGSDTGTVEFIGVRLIKIRKFNGELLMVPAGELRTFGNNSIGFARAIVNIGLAYEQDLEEILPVVKEIADEWTAANEDAILEDEATVQSITDFGDSQITIRVVIQVVPGQQFELERQLRRALKKGFDERGIEIPFPRQTVYLRREEKK